MTLRLVHDSEHSRSAPQPPERHIFTDSAPGGLSMYTFEDSRGNVIGYVQIAIAPADGVIPRRVVELYDACVAEAESRAFRLG